MVIDIPRKRWFDVVRLDSVGEEWVVEQAKLSTILVHVHNGIECII